MLRRLLFKLCHPVKVRLQKYHKGGLTKFAILDSIARGLTKQSQFYLNFAWAYEIAAYKGDAIDLVVVRITDLS
jgi:hypothetical protein